VFNVGLDLNINLKYNRFRGGSIHRTPPKNVLFFYYTMTTTTEPGGRQNRFATEPQVQVIQADYFDNAERVNGQLAMLGFAAALGSYIITGQIIPGIF